MCKHLKRNVGQLLKRELASPALVGMLKDDIDSTERLVVDIIWMQDAIFEVFQY